MRLPSLSLCLLAPLAVALAAPAGAQEAKQDFTLINRTGYELKEVYVGPSASDSWGNDVLGSGTLPDATSAAIRFVPQIKTCKWDLKVIYTVDSSSAVWKDIDLCTVDRITILYDKERDVTQAKFD